MLAKNTPKGKVFVNWQEILAKEGSTVKNRQELSEMDCTAKSLSGS